MKKKFKRRYEVDRLYRWMRNAATRGVMEHFREVEHKRDLPKTIRITLRTKDYEY